ncbi:hypothetical protein MPDQ_000553 [Monascus purpureus]|uniref:Endo-chitosanase n=1 Tax=Monascus purpureus TaxID=5098 RepID=A0A507R182_MONPU|nr:hypothetical protein MPDQ_000553 [Monascus purpureus]BDD64134.1 hypothetical protein MAP00_008979 [Monascus purpureus]
MRFLPALMVAAAAGASAYDIPDNLRKLYDQHKPGKCANKLAGGFTDGGSANGNSFAYCGDIPGAIFLHSQRNGGQYDNMDIDCDGSEPCPNDPSGQDITAFQDRVTRYGINDLNANIHPYVVFGNDEGETFYPDQHGMKPLSVMAVVCNNQVFYGIWGDTNGGKSTGEASIALAKLCYPDQYIDGNTAPDVEDVMYIGFTTDEAYPSWSANWKASTPQEFEDSIKALGDKLVAGLQA